MSRFAKTICGLAMMGWVGFAAQSALGFALLGPAAGYTGSFNTWEIPSIGYNPLPTTSDPQIPGDALPVGVDNINEEFRRNTPIIYWSVSGYPDSGFWSFFGSNGVYAVDQAFNLFNSLTNVSVYDTNLDEFPAEGWRMNYQALNLTLMDVKSTFAHFLMEQMGIASPERYVWCIRDRAPVPGLPCPNYEYLIVMRNLGLTTSGLNQFQYSRYVNDTLYSYSIIEQCAISGHLPPDAYTLFTADPEADIYTAVASDNLGGLGGGGFVTSLTRDDVGGLRYLLATNNVNIESAGPNTEGYFTNTLSATPIITQDLGLLAAEAVTNNAAALMALFPGLIDTSTVIGFQYVTNYNISFIISAPPTAPAGTFIITPVTNAVAAYVPIYSHTLDNVITNTVSTHSLYSIQTLSLTNNPLAPAGSPPILKTSTKTFVTNAVSGDFYFLPTNTCAVKILSNLLTTVSTTFSTVVATNLAGATNVNGGTFQQSTITYFTNHALAYLPVICQTNPVEAYQGVERVRFVHIPDNLVDSLTDLYRIPVTNDYTLIAEDLTNHVYFPLHIQRVAFRPDILIDAQDMLPPSGTAIAGNIISRNVNFNFANTPANHAGPGTIEPPTVFTFNSASPSFENLNPGFISEQDQVPWIIWSSFDGTTNAPIVYPNGTSIANVENRALLGILNPNLPVGEAGTPYSAQLQAGGPNPPFTWALAPGSPGLPPGLSLSSDGVISGTPTQSAMFDFTVRLSDSAGHSADVPFTLTIN